MRNAIQFSNLSRDIKNLIYKLSEKYKIGSLKFIDERFNVVFSGTSTQYGEVIIRIGSSSYKKDFSGILLPEIGGYFDPNKHVKEEKLILIAKKAGIPTPVIIYKGFDNNLVPWCVETKVPGYSFESVLQKLEPTVKLKILKEIGKLLAAFHSQESFKDKSTIKKYWEKRIFAITHNLLVLNVFPKSQLKKISGTLEKLMERMLEVNEGFVGPVHMEIIAKHIFIDKNNSITGIIDWETGEVKGDALCDIVSTAYWLSGKGEYSSYNLVLSNKNEFNSVLRGYGLINKVDRQKVLPSVPFYDLMWLLNILWVKTFQGRSSFIESRKELVTQIVGIYS